MAPISLVFQQPNGRTLLQPWIDRTIHLENPTTESPTQTEEPPVLPHSPAPLLPRPPAPALHYLQQLTHDLSELFLIGLQRVDASLIRYWQDLARQGAALGFVQLCKPIQQLAEALAHKSVTLRWNERPAVEAMLAIALLLKLAQEQ